MVGNIIPAVPDMAGIQADTHFLVELHAVQDFAEFLEASAYLASFSGHCFQQNRSGLVGGENLI